MAVIVQFLGWGRTFKEYPPQIPNLAQCPEFQCSARSTQSTSRDAEYNGSDQLVGLDAHSRVAQPQWRCPRKDLLLGEARAESGSESIRWEEQLQEETICFVFSHEQEGLLAIWLTFALPIHCITRCEVPICPPACVIGLFAKDGWKDRVHRKESQHEIQRNSNCSDSREYVFDQKMTVRLPAVVLELRSSEGACLDPRTTDGNRIYILQHF